jgi:molecular chaperone GrpE
MKHEIPFPKAVVGIYIFNNNQELLLIKSPKWKNKYTCVGGHIEMNESLEKAVRREAKEETNLDVSDPEFIGILDGLELEKHHAQKVRHHIFIDYKVTAENISGLELNKEASGYEWRSVADWLKEDPNNFAPYNREIIEKLAKLPENDFEGLYKRALADYHNLAKQQGIEKIEFIKYANEGLLAEIIPVYDHLKLALKHVDGNKDDGVIDGLKYVLKQFKSVLLKHKVDEIETSGKTFDHNIMDALDQRITSEREKDGMVAEEMKSGYLLNGKVIEPAKVVVWKYEETNNPVK